jgi:hypothetical protein
MRLLTSNRGSGWSLVLAGAAGILFFFATDPAWGLADGGLDEARQAWTGTLVGLGGSAVALAIGLWLLTRRTV